MNGGDLSAAFTVFLFFAKDTNVFEPRLTPPRARLGRDGDWELCEVRLSGGPLQGRLHLRFDESGAPQINDAR